MISSPDQVARFCALPAPLLDVDWLDDEGRGCAPTAAAIVRLSKRVGEGFMTIRIDAGGIDRALGAGGDFSADALPGLST
ncbi:MAG: hypothetical protein P4L73_03460 [Caulobacteraceae bacterium]|nr:hypothetical protein [Caulobacteraceae bacterium]